MKPEVIQRLSDRMVHDRGAACLDIPVRKDFDRPPAEVQQQPA